MSSDQSQQPGLVASHASYVAGATKETVGKALGSTEWSESGVAQKNTAVGEMRAAGGQRDPQQSGWGKAEEIAGKATGCEGMKDEGAQSAQK